MITINYTPEQQAACEEHWRKVRAGLRPPVWRDHKFGTDARQTIAARRYNARLHVEAAAREMRLAADLAEDSA